MRDPKEPQTQFFSFFRSELERESEREKREREGGREKDRRFSILVQRRKTNIRPWKMRTRVWKRERGRKTERQKDRKRVSFLGLRERERKSGFGCVFD